jgi:pimeloyl-ACP methyl ester carboxylesterase
VSAPLLVLWGDADTLTPLDSPVGQFFAALPAERRDTEFVLLEGAGHVPYDDRPDLVHAALLPWVRRVAGGSACSASASEC